MYPQPHQPDCPFSRKCPKEWAGSGDELSNFHVPLAACECYACGQVCTCAHDDPPVEGYEEWWAQREDGKWVANPEPDSWSDDEPSASDSVTEGIEFVDGPLPDMGWDKACPPKETTRIEES